MQRGQFHETFNYFLHHPHTHTHTHEIVSVAYWFLLQCLFGCEYYYFTKCSYLFGKCSSSMRFRFLFFSIRKFIIWSQWRLYMRHLYASHLFVYFSVLLHTASTFVAHRRHISSLVCVLFQYNDNSNSTQYYRKCAVCYRFCRRFFFFFLPKGISLVCCTCCVSLEFIIIIILLWNFVSFHFIWFHLGRCAVLGYCLSCSCGIYFVNTHDFRFDWRHWGKTENKNGKIKNLFIAQIVLFFAIYMRPNYLFSASLQLCPHDSLWAHFSM